MAEIVGARIRALRQELDWTQDELAKKIGVTKLAVLNYENEKRNPEIKTLIALAQHLSCTVEYLVGISDNRQNKIDEATDCWGSFKRAAGQYDNEKQKQGLEIFEIILNGNANYKESAYQDKLFSRRMETLKLQGEFDAYIQEIEKAHEDGSELTAEELVNLYVLNDAVIQTVINANDIGFASAASRLPVGYDLTKRLYGLKFSNIEPEDFKEVYSSYREKKYKEKYGPK